MSINIKNGKGKNKTKEMADVNDPPDLEKDMPLSGLEGQYFSASRTEQTKQRSGNTNLGYICQMNVLNTCWCLTDLVHV